MALYPVAVDDIVICYATNEKWQKLLSQVTYHMRGFFVDGFSEPNITVLEKVNIKDIKEVQ